MCCFALFFLDPECCDGSDEYDGKVKCPNVCANVGKAYRKKKQEAENIQRAGSKTRDKYIRDREKALEGLEAEIVRLEVEVEVAREKEQKAKAALEAAEAMDSKVIAQKMASRELKWPVWRPYYFPNFTLLMNFAFQHFMAH